ncbi:hypothetical protein EsVE80_21830 [Enterococcus saigonensis]|uniref:DNA-binding protein n=1 Tax=Enterococcus saigonensis TaxID=1805431 RepID=A0A679IEA1_9ENTE|nr:hypothetical protein [Enterococcus saigonensis]BCA86660.1 hypothetical protein EsVE80_21830 [Enterococcus saigonensis]
MTYPVTKFIETDLKMSVYAFAKQSSISQQTLSTWKQRDKPVTSLPIQILDEFSYFAEMSMSDIRNKLAQYELENELAKLNQTKEGEHMIDKEESVKLKSFLDAGYKFGKALSAGGDRKNSKIHLQKLLRDSPKQEGDSLDDFLEDYFKLCIAYNIKAFGEMTALTPKNSVPFIQNFLIGAHNATFAGKKTS